MAHARGAQDELRGGHVARRELAPGDLGRMLLVPAQGRGRERIDELVVGDTDPPGVKRPVPVMTTRLNRSPSSATESRPARPVESPRRGADVGDGRSIADLHQRRVEGGAGCDVLESQHRPRLVHAQHAREAERHGRRDALARRAASRCDSRGPRSSRRPHRDRPGRACARPADRRNAPGTRRRAR